MAHRAVWIVCLLLAFAGLAVAQESPLGPGQQEGLNTSEGGPPVQPDSGQGPDRSTGQEDEQNLGHYDTSRDSSLFGVLLIVGLLGLGYFMYRRRGGRLKE